MGKGSVQVAAMVFCGIDVSAKKLDVALLVEGRDGLVEQEFSNTAAGHKLLISWLQRQGARVRVSLEATGVYSLDLALALDQAPAIEVAVLNPKLANRFAETLRRSKNDRTDAAALAEYSRRMPFVAWQRPSRMALELRAITRHLAQLSQERTRLLNRLHAAGGSQTTPDCVRRELKHSLARCEKAMHRLRGEATIRVQQDPALRRQAELMTSIPGVGEASAVQLLSELAGLDPAMTVRQWVALSGLDPVQQSSGSSVRKPAHISRQGNRNLRRALYMPALVASRCDPHLRHFYLTLQQRHKTKLQALIAVARKLLHAIYGICKTATPYDGAKLFPQTQLLTS